MARTETTSEAVIREDGETDFVSTGTRSGVSAGAAAETSGLTGWASSTRPSDTHCPPSNRDKSSKNPPGYGRGSASDSDLSYRKRLAQSHVGPPHGCSQSSRTGDYEPEPALVHELREQRRVQEAQAETIQQLLESQALYAAMMNQMQTILGALPAQLQTIAEGLRQEVQLAVRTGPTATSSAVPFEELMYRGSAWVQLSDSWTHESNVKGKPVLTEVHQPGSRSHSTSHSSPGLNWEGCRTYQSPGREWLVRWAS